MTREERDFAKSRIEYLLKISSFVFDEHDKEALEAAIQALSQEPTVTSTDEPITMVYPTIVCDDAISREAAINIASLHCLTIDETVKAIKNLPSVTQKSGKWIKMFLTDTGDIDGQCSECGFIHKFIDGHTAQYNYCSNCGAKMESEEQTE